MSNCTNPDLIDRPEWCPYHDCRYWMPFANHTNICPHCDRVQRPDLEDGQTYIDFENQ